MSNTKMKIQSKTTMQLPRRKPFFFLVFILQLVACSLWGQVVQKKAVTVNDYPKWGQLNLEKISANAEWVSYNMIYRNNSDTLFVKNTKSLKTYAFPLGQAGDFITADWFVYRTATGLHLMNLKTEKKETIHHAGQYVYAPLSKQLLILVTEKEKENRLLIRGINGSVREHIDGVSEFILDPTNQRVLYATTTGSQHSITLLELSKKNKKTVLFSGPDPFSNMVWHIKGKAVAFMQKSTDASNADTTLFYYDLSNKKLYNSDVEIQNRFLGDSLFIPSKNYRLKISEDLQKVFFVVQRKEKSKENTKDSDVQLWNGNAKWIYPMEEKRNQSTYLALWNPQENQYQLISNDTLPQFMLTGDQRYAIISNPKQYEPQYAYEGPRDFYLVDLSTGKNELLLKKHSANFKHINISPNGKYIAYFQQKNWWVYDIAKKTHTNITKNIKQSFFHNNSEFPQNTDVYSSLEWTLNDKEIILCDAYDLWRISPDGSSANRLTHGRESQMQFRLAGYSQIILGNSNYNGWIQNGIDLNEGLLLEATSKEGQSGYYKWLARSNKKLVVSTNTRLDRLIGSTSGNTFVYTEQRYNLPPRLMVLNDTDKIPQILFQSNPQQEQFYWGKSELIQYKNAKGESLQGILYYPAEYSSKKKYPMIVYIYEKLAEDLHNKYINPSQFTGDGLFNISTFTTQGYFVLAPDISYEIGDPGISATDCVVAATNEIVSRGFIRADKIGLIGHSFGGYEASFIITQTRLFAAAVTGSAATDLSSFYLTVGWNTGRPDMWRFENDQWRMGKSLFEDPQGYDRNSPIEHAENITTPLLSWTGGDDKQVNWSQSMEFYLALRRLKKQHIMLLYPKEGHTLTKSRNQKDLSIRLHEWFDYHLKDESPAAWIKTGLK
jgi:dipeptidyl aminopeptidase/acylaminoacyl peptidase